MKKIWVIAGGAGIVGALLLLTGCLDQGASSGKGPLLRYHFAGRAALGRDGAATILKEVEAMKETTALRSQFAEKLGAAASEIWKADLPADATPQAELLRPLIEDLTISETLVDVRGPTGRAESLVAVELTDERARTWETNLFQLARIWKLGTPAAVTVDGVKGWATRRSQAPAVLQVLRSGKWTIVALGSDRPPGLSAALQAVSKTGRPMPAIPEILDLQADLPGLKSWLPMLAQFPLPPVHVKMIGRGPNVRTEMRMMYSSRIPWKFEPWQIPTNLIKGELMSFTVGQGIKPILERLEGVRDSGFSIPNQFCSWGVMADYGHTYSVVPQPGASNTLTQLAPKFATLIKPYFDTPVGQFNYNSNRGEVIWSGGLPGVTPSLAPAKTDGREFLLFKLFPAVVGRLSLEPALVAQFAGRTNLLYYDWEISSNRVVNSRQLYQLASMFDYHPPVNLNVPSQKFLDAVSWKLDQSATEITMPSPQELLLTRKSQVGFTGIELATFAAWLESPAFPHRIERPQAYRANRTAAQTPVAPPKK